MSQMLTDTYSHNKSIVDALTCVFICVSILHDFICLRRAGTGSKHLLGNMAVSCNISLQFEKVELHKGIAVTTGSDQSDKT